MTKTAAGSKTRTLLALFFVEFKLLFQPRFLCPIIKLRLPFGKVDSAQRSHANFRLNIHTPAGRDAAVFHTGYLVHGKPVAFALRQARQFTGRPPQLTPCSNHQQLTHERSSSDKVSI
jgi:hypothetical protein